MALPATTDDGLSESEWLGLEKQRLECEKLRFEIAQAAAPWWTRPGYIGSLMPMVLALIAVLFALAAGVFDTERAQLKAEVDALALTRDRLLAANEATQKRIDHAYLLLRLAGSEAEYAIGDISGMEPLRDELVPKVEAAMAKLPRDQSDAVGELLALYELSGEIARVTEEGLGTLNESLAAIPASSWAVALQPTLAGLIVPDRALLEAPDGRFYDPAAGRYYTRAELGQ
jgi:hypothetical protein